MTSRQNFGTKYSKLKENLERYDHYEVLENKGQSCTLASNQEAKGNRREGGEMNT
jgi:hypothetical protein